MGELTNKRILVVEDDPASAKLVAVVLRDEGAEVEAVATAEEGLRSVEARKPDAIVLDLILPMMSGLLFAEHVRRRPATAEIPIIAVSAFNGREAERVALAAGCSVYLRKPIDALALPHLLLAHLGGGR
jgi:CheY-like chemotaxis protein